MDNVTAAKEAYEKFRTTWISTPALIPWEQLTTNGKQRIVNQYLNNKNTRCPQLT